MFRRKFMITCTIFLVAIVATMIWSSFVIKDKTNNGLETQVINTRGQNAPESVDYQSKEPVEGAQNVSAVTPESSINAELDNSDITPVIAERRKKVETIDRNYLGLAITDHKLALWNTKSFPLKVFISSESSLPNGYADGIRVGITNWQNASNQFFTFTYVSSSEKADIIVSTVDHSKDCINGETGKATLNSSGTTLYHAKLEVPQMSCEDKLVPSKDVHLIVQHQIGHILGIDGHSQRSADVMFNKSSYENINISSIDIATMKYLYEFAPEITNIPYSAAEIKKKLKVIEVRGKSNAEIEKYLENNLINKFAKEDPLDVVISNANTYYKGKNYTQALKWYNHALTISKDSQSLSYIYYSLAVINLEQNRPADALYNANMAYKEASTPVNAYLIAYINFREGQTDRAREQLEYIIQNYPKIRPAYSLLGQIYLSDKDPQKLADLTKKANENFQFNPPIKVKE